MGQITSRGKWTRVTEEGINLVGLNTPYIKWGIAADDPNGGQSGYEFEGVSDHAHLDGTKFKLGKFTHHNRVVVLTKEVQFWAELNVEVYFADGDITHSCTARFRHDETPNVNGYVDDIVKLPTIDEPEFVHVDGVEYSVSIHGFLVGKFEKGVPDFPQHEFNSPEGESSEAYIIAEFTRTSPPGG